jgi:hypothetical protein
MQFNGLWTDGLQWPLRIAIHPEPVVRTPIILNLH